MQQERCTAQKLSNEEGKDQCALRGKCFLCVSCPQHEAQLPKPPKNLVEEAEGHPSLHLHGIGLVSVRIAGVLWCLSGGAC